MRSLIFLCAAVALSACGSSSPGGPCNTTGFLCSDASHALECQLSKWVELPCSGPTGCQRDGNTIKCDMSGNKEGDNCATTAVGSGLCFTDSNGMQGTLECRNDAATMTNTLKKTNSCRTCTVMRNASSMKDEVICQP